MLVGIKNVSKLIGISIIACCAVLVCTMFLNFYFDIRLIESEITSELSMFFYNAQVMSNNKRGEDGVQGIFINERSVKID